MDTVLTEAWMTERFLAWEDQQEGRHECDGQSIIPMTGGSLGHQRIVFNHMVALSGLLDGQTQHAAQDMRIRVDAKMRYPDVCVFTGRFNPAVRTLTDAAVIFEVLAGDTAVIDRVDKLLDYATLPSLRGYVLLEQVATIALPGLDISLSLPDLDRGLTFAA